MTQSQYEDLLAKYSVPQPAQSPPSGGISLTKQQVVKAEEVDHNLRQIWGTLSPSEKQLVANINTRFKNAVLYMVANSLVAFPLKNCDVIITQGPLDLQNSTVAQFVYNFNNVLNGESGKEIQQLPAPAAPGDLTLNFANNQAGAKVRLHWDDNTAVEQKYHQVEYTHGNTQIYQVLPYVSDKDGYFSDFIVMSVSDNSGLGQIRLAQGGNTSIILRNSTSTGIAVESLTLRDTRPKRCNLQNLVN
jgi:hypothetical protein